MMNFCDDPRRDQIEPMHEFLMMWAEWGRNHQECLVSPTWKIMNWVKDHAKRTKEIEEQILNHEPIRLRSVERDFIAWKVERLLTHSELWEGHIRERNVLKTYYLLPCTSKPGFIARKLDCKPWQIEKIVKEALYYFSTVWGS